MIIKNKNKLLISAFCSMLLSGVCASGSSTDPLPLGSLIDHNQAPEEVVRDLLPLKEECDAQRKLDEWIIKEKLVHLPPLEEGKMDIFLGKDETSEISEAETRQFEDICSLSGKRMEFVYTKKDRCYHVKYDGKIFIFPENSINKPTLFIQESDHSFLHKYLLRLFIQESDHSFLKHKYLLRLQSCDDKTLNFIVMKSFKVNVDNRSPEETQNDRIDLFLTLAEQGLMPAKYIVDSDHLPKPIQELLGVDKDFSYLRRFYLRNMMTLNSGLMYSADHSRNMMTLKRELMYNADRFMSLINGRYYTDAKPMPDLFPYINKHAAINLLRADADFFLKHLNQFFANEDMRTSDYAGLYAILSNKETSVEEKIEQIELRTFIIF